MKKLFYILFAVVLFLNGNAQSPASFNYQAVIRDASGNILANKQVLIELEILKGSFNDSLVYAEEWDIITNILGLVNVEVGSKDPLNFQCIDWSDGPYFLALSVDGELLGSSQLLSVPYALHAKTADRVKNLDFAISGDETSFTNWDKDVTDDFDGEYSSLSGKPTNVSTFNNDAGYLTNDSIAHLTIGINAGDTTNWNNKQDLLTGNEAIFNGWDKDASNDFDGSYTNLIGKPTRLGQFSNDVGFLTAEVDASVSNEIQALSISNDTVFLSQGGFIKLPAGNVSAFDISIAKGITAADTANWNQKLTAEVDGSVTNEIQVLSISNDTIFLSDGGFVKLPAETDPVFTAWDKSSGITITQSQISDLSPGIVASIFEKELAKDENNIDVGFELLTTSLVFFNGAILPANAWSGAGTQMLNLNINTDLYDNLKVKR